MNYFDALRIYNEGKPAWCSPRRGTFEYKAVMAIMKGTAVSPPKKDSDAGSMSMSMSPAPVKPKRKYTRKPKATAPAPAPSPAPKKRGRPPKICYDKDGNIIHKTPRKPRLPTQTGKTGMLAGSLGGSARLLYPKSSSSKKSSAPSAGSAGYFGGVSTRSLPMTANSAMTAKSASMMGSTTMSMARNISLPKSTTPPKPAPKKRGGNPVGRPRKQAGAPKQKYTRKPKTLMAMGQAVSLPKSSRSGQFV
jgi:hypothetical protein